MANPTHYAVLLVSASPNNPDGLPANWHMDARASGPVLDPSLSALGYILLTAAEFDQRQVTFGPEYQLYLTTTRADKETANSNKLRDLRKLFDDGDVLNAKITAGTATASDLRDLGVIGYQINRLNKRNILDNFKA